MLFDSHAHIDSEAYDENRDELIREIEASPLSYVMDVGFDLPSSRLAAEHAARWPWCYAAVGMHPHDSKDMDEAMLEEFRTLAAAPKVRAIGEIGLDFHYDLSPRETQEYWFRRQLRLALELEMPIVIHTREADGLTMEILQEEGVFLPARTERFPQHPDGGPDARVLLHCYSGSREMALQYVALGASLSVGGPLTFKNNRRAVETAGAVPLSRLLAETDSPYLTPEPFRGRQNRPPYVEHTVRRLAEIREIPYEEAAAATLENAKRFFGIA